MRTLLFFMLLGAAAHVSGQRSGFGAGLIVGAPTGFSVKGWLSEDKAIDGALAWNLGHGSVLRLHADYLFHKDGLFHVETGDLLLYYGVGARIRFWNGDRHWRNGDWHDGGGADLGVRFPVGLNYHFEGAPVDCFVELAPVLGLVPATYFDLDGGIGARYWF